MLKCLCLLRQIDYHSVKLKRSCSMKLTGSSSVMLRHSYSMRRIDYHSVKRRRSYLMKLTDSSSTMLKHYCSMRRIDYR